jgi:hypothetical protein
MADRPETKVHRAEQGSDPFAEYRDGGRGSLLPKLKSEGNDGFEQLSFGRTQKIQQLPGESSEALHERLRPQAVNSFESVRKPTQIDTPSWYTFDASKILGIENAEAIATSTCKHELPYKIFVGIRGADWDTSGRLPSGEIGHRYRLYDLGRELTESEKNAIYNRM